MQGLLKYDYAEPDATGTAHANIDEILAGNKAKHQQAQYDLHGTIGPTPFWETEEGQQEMYDMAEGFAFPGSAIGRISKGAITGGHKLIKAAPKLKLMGRDAGDLIKGFFKTKAGKKMLDEDKAFLDRAKKIAEKHAISKIQSENKINTSRIALETAYNKHGLRHETVVNDPVTEILRGYKYRKN